MWGTSDAVNELAGNGAVTIELTTITHIWFTAFNSIAFNVLPSLRCTDVWQFSAALALWGNSGLRYQQERLHGLCLPALVSGCYHHYVGFLSS